MATEAAKVAVDFIKEINELDYNKFILERKIRMIYYFSGTGNSMWIAEELASITGDIALNIMDSSASRLIEGQTIGIVFPVYAWGPPEVVLDFVKKLDGKPSFTFAVSTCGEEAGYSMEKLNESFHLDSMYSICMPNNYLIGSDLESDEVVRSKISKAKENLQGITLDIINKKLVNNVNRGKLPWIKSNVICYGFNKVARSTKSFYATDKCTSCQICIRNCPTKTISLANGKPNWGKKCFHCTACINLCPEEAIQYGKGTLKRKRYNISKYI